MEESYRIVATCGGVGSYSWCMADLTSMFISHSHHDSEFAQALKRLFESAIPKLAGSVEFSSDVSPDGGISAGEEWREWIKRQVLESGRAIIVLTPRSVDSDWVQWEAGAVEGVRLAEEKHSIRVLPVLFGVTRVPSTLSNLNYVDGSSVGAMKKLVTGLQEDAGMSGKEMVAKNDDVDRALKTFVETVEALSTDIPAEPTEATMQEWISRIDDLARQGRSSEVGSLHQWLELAFGLDDPDARQAPLDVRIHRRLGEMYLGAKRFGRAIKQFDLARKSAPRDLFLLRNLGLAYVAASQLDEAGAVIERIEELDPEAFTKNPECVGLKGRWYRTRWEQSGERDRASLEKARDTYLDGAEATHGQYYLADVAAQLSLQLDDETGAGRSFDAVLTAVGDLGTQSIWSHASAANALLYQGRSEDAMVRLNKIADLGPDARQISSIESGLARMAKLRPESERTAALTSWKKALRGDS